MVRRARAVGALLFADDEEEIDALLARFDEVLGGGEHRRGDTLRVARTAAVEPVSTEPRREERRHGIEVRRERDAASARDAQTFPRPGVTS